MTNETIGTIKCQLCNEKASVKLSKKQKAYYSCENCGVQMFARGSMADGKMRKMMKKPKDPSTNTDIEKEPEQEPKKVASSGGWLGGLLSD